jgi:hypothetical protein
LETVPPPGGCRPSRRAAASRHWRTRPVSNIRAPYSRRSSNCGRFAAGRASVHFGVVKLL